MPESSASQPFGRLVSEDDRADAILVQHAAAFGEGFRHRLLEPPAVLWLPVGDLLGFVLHGLGLLGESGYLDRMGRASDRVIG